ncbi:MAG: amino acid adenylation domain-containing protein [Betaproteobacteria bacterium]
MSEVNLNDAGVTLGHDPFGAGQVERVVPTTEAQREVWLADLLGAEASLAYNESASLWFEGALDAKALDAALSLIIERHEALRCTIGSDGTELWVHAPSGLAATLLDVEALSEPARLQALAAARAKAAEARFDLATGPLIRAELLRTDATHHELMLTAHHIVCDGWSLGVLANELVSVYRAFADAQPSMLDPAPRYSDYALAQLEPEALRSQEQDERYWVGVYDQSIPTLDLPGDRPRKAGHRSFASRREDLLVDPTLTAAIKRFGAQQGAGLFATLFTVYAALLARLSGAEEVVVGVPAAGQPVSGMPGLVGHCVNLMPIRMAVDMNQPMGARIDAARGAVLDAYDHQGCTFGSLLKKLRVDRDPARLPLVSVMFNLDSTIDMAALSDSALRVRVVGNPRRYENFELFLNVTQVDGGLSLECQYNTDLFDAATVARWLSLYRAALERCAGDPSILVGDALAPTAAERALLDQFNATDFEHDRSVRVDTLISRRAAQTPDAVAVVAADVHLTYRELEGRANALATELRRREIGQGDLVGISCGRNEHMLVALLGVLKSGAGYVPLDPDLPRQRLEFMAQDAALQCVLSDATVTGEWPFVAAQRIDVDGFRATAAPWTQLGSVDDPAYVIYTSGSTGKPKGVRVPHRSVVNLLTSLRSAPGMTSASRVLSVTTLSFDIAVSELIAPLAAGARIIISDKSQAVDGERLRELIERENVDLIDGTPSTYRLLVGSGWPGNPGLVAICIGEPLPPDLARQLIPIVGELWNAYGPTETTVWSTMQRVERVDGPVPIGRPIENTQIHIVDDRLRLLPIGVVGEIYIAGEGVTLGYLNRPELNEQRFVAPPAGATPRNNASRWYQTGDLGRWRPDGILECLGRIDHQVKVRGYRIELGEIESALLRHASVGRAVVITREDVPDDVRIVAYIVPRGAPFEDMELRRHLAETLPVYMIPQQFVSMASLPELHNGKLNRHALPKPGQVAKTRVEARVAPRNDVERQVLDAMERVLDLPGLGVLDNFFALGGHSLLAMRLIARLNAEFGVALPLRTLFEASTAEALAVVVAGAPVSGGTGRRVIAHDGNQQVAPLTLAQDRIRFLEELQPGRVLFNTPSAHRLTGAMDTVVFERALREVVRRQSVLRTRIVPSDDGQTHVQRIEDDVEFALPFDDLSAVPEAERESTLLARMQAIVDQPIPIGEAPLFRVALWKLAHDQHAFLFMPHHIIWDGWSFDIFYTEMSAIYGALSTGTPIALAAPAITYADYSRWFAVWMNGPDCERQLQYWKKRFANSAMPKAPATDKPRNPGMSGVGATEWVSIDQELTARLRDVARRHDLTLSMLTMSVYAAMMAAAIDGRAIVVGLPVRGRLSPETEGVMGFFNNLLPVQFEFEPNKTLSEFLDAVKRDTLDVFEHQEIPFERLAGEPEISGRAQRVGLYQALFSFQDARDRKRDWGALRQQAILIFQKGATEDLGLWLMEVPGGLEGGFTYNADIYLSETAVAFRERYLELLRRIAGDPSLKMSEFTDVGSSPSAQLLRRLSGSAAQAVAAATQPAATDAAAPARPVVAFGSEHERSLARIWSELLNIDIAHVSPRDNFFDLGGDSLLAMRAVEAAGRALGFRIDARRYFYETLGQLANVDAAVTIAPASVAAPARKEQESGGLLKRVFGAFASKGRK